MAWEAPFCQKVKIVVYRYPTQHLYEKREGSGSVTLTNGSGTGRPKHTRIPNTDLKLTQIEDEVVGYL